MNPRQGKFFWKLFLSHAVLLTVVVGTCVWLTLGALDGFLAQKLTSDLRSRAEFLHDQLQNRLQRGSGGDLDRLIKKAAEAGADGVRVTLVLPDGTVLADSEADPAEMESHAERPEIRAALHDGWGESTRFSRTVDRNMTYVALRVGPVEQPNGVVRLAMPERSIVAHTREARHLLWRIGATLIAAACILALVLAWLWSGPIARITATARTLSRGDLSARADVAGNDEIALLARSLNRMRDSLARQVETIDRQRRTLENLLAQLHEGVVVTGPTGRIVLLNPAAAKLLDLPPERSDAQTLRGSPVEAAIPQPSLQRMLTPAPIGEVTERAAPGIAETRAAVQEERLTFRRTGSAVSLLARASDIVLPGLAEIELQGGSGRQRKGEDYVTVGRLLVLTDITELTRTIQVKTDFVANASHELRTPLSTIRGAVETLMSMDWAVEREAAAGLLDMIDRHSGRLEAMVSDLLDLSRLESASAPFESADVPLADVVQDVFERVARRIEAKRLRWETALSGGRPRVWANRELLRLVLDNLVDNAVKFAEEGGSVRVSSAGSDGSVRITVEDDGCGIPPEEHDRVFERFYQVERSRGGPNRGTGLGLSIVRHAVNAMKGAIELDSGPGRGTRIAITLPQPGSVRGA